MSLLSEAYQSAVNNDPYAGLGQKIKNSIGTTGGWLGKNSMASKVGNFLSWHPTRSLIPTTYAANDEVANQDNNSNQNPNSDEELDQLRRDNPAPTPPGATKSGGGSSGSSNDAKILASIGASWDDTGDSIKSASKSLSSSKNYINNLGKVRDQYLKSIESWKQKNDTAIAGNKTLIEQNQKKALDDLAGETRKSMDNTNVMLGVKGASGGSASKAAARAIAASAGKSRSGVLTNYGDETSKQNQAAKNLIEDYNTKRAQAYEWEKTARQQAMDDYNEEKDALDRLKSKSGDWRDEDIKAMSDRNLNKFFSQISDIQNKARAFRDNLAAKMTEYGGNADALDQAGAYIDAPAELDTPTFSENIDLTDPNNATDWFDPQNNGKKIKVKSRDALGNPTAYEDASGVEVDENGNPISA